MPGHVIVVDLFGLVLAIVGFTMAFRQDFVRRILNPGASRKQLTRSDRENDPMTYILRIAGVMTMVFGVVLAGMITLFSLA